MKLALYNLTTTTRWGGVETFVWEVAAQMAQRGHQVEIFGGRGKIIHEPIPGVRVRRFPYIDRDLWRKLPLLGRQYTLTKLLERLSMAPFALIPLLRGRFDLVHIQKPYDLPVGALAKLSGAKFLFGCHGKDFWLGDRLFVRFADGSVSASKYNASQISERYGIRPVVVYNGVDLDLFTPEGKDDEAILSEYGLSVSEEKPVLLYAGRLVRWKGVEYLIEAMPKIEPAGTQLWIAGEGPYGDTLREMAERLGVADRVHFLGKLEQEKLAALYRRCTALVATSFVNETFGMALCEAMACGAPVVASDFGGFREVVEDGVTGLLAKPQDPDDLAHKINKVLADPGMAHKMGTAGREKVHSMFSWRAVGDRLEEVYRRVKRGDAETRSFLMKIWNRFGYSVFRIPYSVFRTLKTLTNLRVSASPRLTTIPQSKIQNPKSKIRRPLLYIAYPMRLDLGAANAIQTYATVRELRRLLPGVRLVIPRWLREKSAFEALDALHLPRPAVNKLSKFAPWAGWSYIERTLYAFMLVVLLVGWRLALRASRFAFGVSRFTCGYPVLYVRDSVCAAWLGLLSGVHGARVIYEVHDLEAAHPSQASKWPRSFWARFLPWLDHTALGRAHKLASLTETFREWVISQGLRKESDIVVIPDAFDPTLYYPMDMATVRAKVGLPQDAFIVGYAGLTFAYRRLDLLVETFAPIARKHKHAMLVLVGGRPAEVSELKKLASKLGIPEDRIVTPGQLGQDRAALYMNAADVLVIPDTVTGMTASPLKLFEYMAVGKPLICKDMPALREIINEDAAIFFPGGDAIALADAIISLMDNPAQRERMGHAALEQSRHYTYRARAEKIAEVVESCR